MQLFRIYTSLFLLCSLSLFSTAQENSAKKMFLKVSGEVTKPLTLSVDDLAKMKRSTQEVKDRDGKTMSYTGVTVQEILELAGVTMGKQLRGENLSKYLMVKCADGYEVLFSLAEVDSSFTDRVILLADESGGKPIPADKDPFRLVVPGEKKPARSCYQVIEFVIRFAMN
jgi:DMSO/TMAO reductase YedYZ molybdopterin-dependent catalytic subunit